MKRAWLALVVLALGLLVGVGCVADRTGGVLETVGSAEPATLLPAQLDLAAQGDAEITFSGAVEACLRSDDSETVGSVEAKENEGAVEANLIVKASITENFYGKIVLDLENDGEQLEEAYFCWKQIAGQPLSLKFGKKEVEFGQDMPLVETDLLVHGGINVPLPANTVGDDIGLPGEVDHTWMVELGYAFNDQFEAFLTLFQNRTMADEVDADGDPQDMGLASFCVTGKYKNKDMGLSAELGYVSVHLEKPQDVAGVPATFGDESSVSALCVAATWKGDMGLEVFGEVLMGFNWAYNDEVDTSTFQIGVKYEFTEGAKIGVVYEMATIENDTLGAAYDEEQYSSLGVALSYSLPETGATVYLEYIAQEGEYTAGAVDTDSTDNRIEIGTKWSF